MAGFDFVQPMLEAAVSKGVFPAGAAAWGVQGRAVEIRCAGQARPDTRFDLASLSKVLGPGMLALRGLQQGELTLEDTVADFLPAPPDKAGITLRQLLTHTAGLIPFYPIYEELSDPSRALESIFGRPLASEPGGAPAYSCIGFILLGKLLEALYGSPLDVLAREKVFVPLGMRDTGYRPLNDAIETAAESFAPTEVDPATGAAWQGVVHDENARFLGGAAGNAGIFSTVRDMAKFAAMLACGGDGFLSPATLRAATVNHTPGCAERRGLSFQLASAGTFFGDLFPEASFGHAGFTGASMAVDPTTGFFAVLLTNRVHPTRDNASHTRFRRIFHNRLYAAFSGT